MSLCPQVPHGVSWDQTWGLHSEKSWINCQSYGTTDKFHPSPVFCSYVIGMCSNPHTVLMDNLFKFCVSSFQQLCVSHWVCYAYHYAQLFWNIWVIWKSSGHLILQWQVMAKLKSMRILSDIGTSSGNRICVEDEKKKIVQGCVKWQWSSVPNI